MANSVGKRSHLLDLRKKKSIVKAMMSYKLSHKMKEKAKTKMMKKIDEAIAKTNHLPIKRRKSRPRAKRISIHPHRHFNEQTPPLLLFK